MSGGVSPGGGPFGGGGKALKGHEPVPSGAAPAVGLGSPGVPRSPASGEPGGAGPGGSRGLPPSDAGSGPSSALIWGEGSGGSPACARSSSSAFWAPLLITRTYPERTVRMTPEDTGRAGGRGRPRGGGNALHGATWLHCTDTHMRAHVPCNDDLHATPGSGTCLPWVRRKPESLRGIVSSMVHSTTTSLFSDVHSSTSSANCIETIQRGI